jgi:hypothetical protein
MFEQTHLTPLSGRRQGALGLLATGSFRGAMMRGRAFILLKSAPATPQSSGQAERGLAGFAKILRMSPVTAMQRLVEFRTMQSEVVSGSFCRIGPMRGDRADVVTWITVLARKPMQYSAKGSRRQVTKVYKRTVFLEKTWFEPRISE